MIKENQQVLNRFYVICDAFLIIFSFQIAWLIRFEIFPPQDAMWWPMRHYMQFLIFLVPIYLIVYYFSSVYSPMRQMRFRNEIGNFIRANVIAIISFPLLLYLLKEGDISRSFMAIFFFTNIFFGVTFRFYLRKILYFFRKKGYNQKHMLLVGYSAVMEQYIKRILANPGWGYTIYGILDDHTPIGTRFIGIEVIGKTDELPDLLGTHKFDEIAVTLKLSDYDNLEKIVAVCEKNGTHTQFVPDYHNVIPTTAHTEDVEGLPVINIRNVPLASPFNRMVKRLIDLIGGIVMLIVFAIPMLITAIAVKVSSPGPLIFKQVRVGLHNKEFNMYKFRSMRVEDPKKEKKEWTTKGDPRVTKVGRFIRKTSIDELPQVFNVLKGDMSLVGPRPERPYFVEKFQEEIPRYNIKHQVRPGITGWAQVNGYRGDTSIKKRIEYDIYYIEHWTVGFDFKILFLTFFKGFVNKNAY